MSKRWMTWSVVGAVAAAAMGFAGARALATGAPQLSPLTYGGVLTDKDGKPYPAAQEVVIKFYDKVDATAAKCVAPGVLAEAGTGRFSVVLPGECAQAVRDTPDLWSEATVGGGKTVLPRVHVGAVPYALEADSAKVAGSAAAATGALKVAMDGVTADVAALKKAPAGGGGGGPKVVDAAGVVLGTMWVLGAQDVVLFTSKAIPVRLMISGSYAGGALKFLSKDCVGAPMGDNYFEGEVFPPILLSNSGVQYVTAQAVGTKQLYGSQRSAEGKCTNGVGSGVLVPLKVVTPQEIGLPDNITGPLKIVP